VPHYSAPHFQTFKDIEYTICLGENQIVDVLESGRSNVRYLYCGQLINLTISMNLSDLVFAFEQLSKSRIQPARRQEWTTFLGATTGRAAYRAEWRSGLRHALTLPTLGYELKSGDALI
jgi:hypothetical protein